MALINLKELSDSDLAEMMDGEVPCELGNAFIGTARRLPGKCQKTATHAIKLTCSSCGKSGTLRTCLRCARLVRWGLKLRVLQITAEPHSCRQPIRWHVNLT